MEIRRVLVGRWLLGVLGAVAIGVLAFGQPVTQNPAYHSFADQRTLWHIPHFWNVASNAAFAVAACMGTRALRNSYCFRDRWERWTYGLLLAGLAGVSAGSAYYHLQPCTERLFWDRLPMTIVFMSLLALVIGDRINLTAGRKMAVPLLAAGIGSVLYWRLTGDLRPYGVVQIFPMAAIPAMVLCFPSRYSGGIGVFAMAGMYLVAKLLELFDPAIGRVLPMGGHALKHIVAAGAMFLYGEILRKRRRIS